MNNLPGIYMVLENKPTPHMVKVVLSAYDSNGEDVIHIKGEKEIDLALSDFVLYAYDEHTPVFKSMSMKELAMYPIMLVGSCTATYAKDKINKKEWVKIES